MANISLRSPQYKNIVAAASGSQQPLSVRCTINITSISGTQYVLIKNNPVLNENVQFDISELARDYINVGYSTNYSPPNVSIVTSLVVFSGLNATGNALYTATFIDTGFESYGTFEEGANPIILPTATKQYFIAPVPNGVDSSLTNPRFKIFLPYGKSTVVYHQSTFNQQIVQNVISPTDTVIGNQGGNAVVLVIERIDCTKYGDGVKIIFINKYGALQDLWFFLKQTKSLNRTNEKYKSNTIDYGTNAPATYSLFNAPTKIFNTQGKQSHTLSSGYYPEFANEFFEQLLLSEYVWMEKPSTTGGGNYQVPVIVKTSNIDFKTSVNDRLIQYTIQFEESFDYINNIR